MGINDAITVAVTLAMNIITFLAVFLITDAANSIFAAMIIAMVFTAIPLIGLIRILAHRIRKIQFEGMEYAMKIDTENGLLKRKIISMENAAEVEKQ